MSEEHSPNATPASPAFCNDAFEIKAQTTARTHVRIFGGEPELVDTADGNLTWENLNQAGGEHCTWTGQAGELGG